MEIISGTDFSYKKLYCPSTGEVILSPVLDEITIKPKAVLAIWDQQFIDKPEIFDPNLKAAWNKFFLKWWNAEINIAMVENFLSEYENPDGKVYECNLEGIACGPISRSLFYVGKTDAIVEEHPLFIDEDPMPQQIETDKIRTESKSTVNDVTDEELIKNIK